MQAIQSKIRLEMIETGGRWCRRLGWPRSTGQIYGLLYLSLQPCSLDDIVALLGISKASASMGTRQLASWGAIRQVWVPGDRRDYFEVIEDLSGLLRGGYQEFVKPRLDSSQQKLERMMAALDEELARGLLTREEFKVCVERIKNLSRLQKKLQAVAPLLEEFL